MSAPSTGPGYGWPVVLADPVPAYAGDPLIVLFEFVDDTPTHAPLNVAGFGTDWRSQAVPTSGRTSVSSGVVDASQAASGLVTVRFPSAVTQLWPDVGALLVADLQVIGADGEPLTLARFQITTTQDATQ